MKIDYDLIGQYILDLGEDFRGLRRSKMYIAGKARFSWSVTYIFDSDVIETSYYDSPVNALHHALAHLDRLQ